VLGVITLEAILLLAPLFQEFIIANLVGNSIGRFEKKVGPPTVAFRILSKLSDFRNVIRRVCCKVRGSAYTLPSIPSWTSHWCDPMLPNIGLWEMRSQREQSKSLPARGRSARLVRRPERARRPTLTSQALPRLTRRCRFVLLIGLACVPRSMRQSPSSKGSRPLATASGSTDDCLRPLLHWRFEPPLKRTWPQKRDGPRPTTEFGIGYLSEK
jgi:hypothetical protein